MAHGQGRRRQTRHPTSRFPGPARATSPRRPPRQLGDPRLLSGRFHPDCTKQFCNYRDGREEIDDLDAEVDRDLAAGRRVPRALHRRARPHGAARGRRGHSRSPAPTASGRRAATSCAGRSSSSTRRAPSATARSPWSGSATRTSTTCARRSTEARAAGLSAARRALRDRERRDVVLRASREGRGPAGRPRARDHRAPRPRRPRLPCARARRARRDPLRRPRPRRERCRARRASYTYDVLADDLDAVIAATGGTSARPLSPATRWARTRSSTSRCAIPSRSAGLVVIGPASIGVPPRGGVAGALGPARRRARARTGSTASSPPTTTAWIPTGATRCCGSPATG